MTAADAARTALDDAKRLLEQVEADHERFDEFLTFPRDSGNRAADPEATATATPVTPDRP